MSSENTFLGAAAAIGRRIVADAEWYDGRCNWVGASPDSERPWRVEYGALGPALYDGTAGVGLFLAQLAAATRDAAARRTAVGALRQAVDATPELPPSRRDGFHAGSLGVAWAAARAAVLLDADELRDGAWRLALTARPPSVTDRCPDVVLGAAGAILGLLALADAFDRPELIDDARATGRELIARATVGPHGWSWATPGYRYPHHLGGLAHGAAGIGWALLELFTATRDERFRAAVAGAFAYERSWLDADSGSWPDLRIAGQRRGAARPIVSPMAGTWCHGEAGIALTRLRAVEVLGPQPYQYEAEVALDATRRELGRTLPDETDDLTLCHGTAGAADVLLRGAAVLGRRWVDAADLARHVARAALAHHEAADDDWPCGMGGATTPGLFRGLSGIAWWWLRLHDPAVPSPLTMPGPRLTGVPARA
jgi:lantibiotic modifying enzyme